MKIKVQRGPGGGKLIRKRVQRKWLYDVVKAQQLQLNQFAELFQQARKIAEREFTTHREEVAALEKRYLEDFQNADDLANKLRAEIAIYKQRYEYSLPQPEMYIRDAPV